MSKFNQDEDLPVAGGITTYDSENRQKSSKNRLNMPEILSKLPGFQDITPREQLTREPVWDPTDPESDWYNRTRKFDRLTQVKFLDSLSKCGRLGLSAFNVGVTPATVNRCRKEDPEFDDLCVQAAQYYKESTTAILTHQALEGILDIQYSKEGDVLRARRVYETPLRLRLLSWADPDFVERRQETVNVQQGGAILVPVPEADISNWDSVVKSVQGTTIDTTGVEAGDSERRG